MNRKIAFIITLVLYLSVGAAGFFVFSNSPDMKPIAVASTAVVPENATLSAPVRNEQEAESTETELPSLPELPPAPSAETESAETESTEPESEVLPEPEYTYTASHSSQRLFIRDGASMRAKIIGFLRPGESGDVISIGESWVLVKHGDIEGYVFKEYLTLTERQQSEDPLGL
jgi:uncharacterized protein YgiM (DUF1202 family)